VEILKHNKFFALLEEVLGQQLWYRRLLPHQELNHKIQLESLIRMLLGQFGVF
jgi:hypothetical protein